MHKPFATDLSAERRPFFGLGWKVLIGISLALAIVILSLTLYSRKVLVDQFERSQAYLRHRQTEHFASLIADRFQQMARLASMVPRLESPAIDSSAADHLRDALQVDGTLLDLEWDIRSVHWIKIGGASLSLWPSEGLPLPASLLREVQQHPEQISEHILCSEDTCRQYLASPVLWDGKTAGSLVLGRTMASILLAFRELTDSDLAIARPADAAQSSTASAAPPLQFFGATQAEQVLPLLQSIPTAALLASSSQAPLAIQLGGDWYEVFRIDPADSGLIGFIINRITDARRSINQMSRNSLLIGLLGLLVAEALLLLIMRRPINRIRTLSRLLPLLAENRFETLADQLQTAQSPTGLRDEIDETIDVALRLNQRMAHMQAERETAQDELRWLADHDPLTALLNRRRFDQELTKIIEFTERNQGRGALIFIDLDNFKDVNDTSGHQIGDRLLKRIGKRLKACLSADDKIGRFGGDEFVVLVATATQELVLDLAEQLQERIHTTWVRAKGHRHQVSASIGIVLFPDHGNDPQTLMANADLAMYQAKAQHRQRCHLYSNQDTARAAANARVLWNRAITEAIKVGRLRLFYQPLMALPERTIWRAEGLLRMQLADGRLASPNEFIPIAERSGLINAIDRWVMAEAIRVLTEHPHLSLSINLSAKALADTSIEAELARLLRSSQVDPQRLTLEITETVAIDSISAAVERIKSMRALGCHFALDDFGSGFASYAYLKQLPVDDVKIDGSFIRNLDRNAEDRIFVQATTEMAHAMGKKVVAEFVESEAILEVLFELGVDFAQGYFIGRPAPEPPTAAQTRAALAG
ncbi:EAL domain-containing protein [Lamprobacter modestohalophilus]|uniref:putative bifunctional diguanylate cyclase/phosphodiesterase n=1 Tax=Lamprobacter modestohalophilus TaxID=1064514 RepID=UPI002ADECC83|nr:EAL domain-containing protein [Lamprobacter modestohalophilus]MEA1049959.1 EAL domain-containing protein [Lamprobacter modestohalophilus]